jgi:hypothetical protein
MEQKQFTGWKQVITGKLLSFRTLYEMDKDQELNNPKWILYLYFTQKATDTFKHSEDIICLLFG